MLSKIFQLPREVLWNHPWGMVAAPRLRSCVLDSTYQNLFYGFKVY